MKNSYYKIIDGKGYECEDGFHGFMISKIPLVEGVRSGEATFYHFNGFVSSICNYVDDQLCGIDKIYSTSQCLDAIRTWEKYQLNGISVDFNYSINYE